MRGVCNVPSGCFLAALTKILVPGLRSIQKATKKKLDCFVAALLAMTAAAI
jgi:hypothetical protein